MRTLSDAVLRASRGLEARLDRVVRWPTRTRTESDRLIAELKPSLVRAGFVMRLARSRWPALDEEAGGRRHVAILVRGRRDRMACAAMLRDLARQSGRAHMVIDLTSVRGDTRRSPAKIRAPASRTSVRKHPTPSCRDALNAVREALASNDRQSADASLVALLLSVAAYGSPATPELRQLVVRVCEAGRHIELLERLRTMRLERAFPVFGWPSIAPAASGRRLIAENRGGMMNLDSLPGVLQELAEAEDDLAALTGVGHWARRVAEADFVAFVATGDGRIVHTDGRRGEALEDEERRAAMEAERATPVQRADGVTVIAPIRYAGVAVGAIVLRGACDREVRLMQAAETAAALAGPAMRARLDVLLIQANPADRVPELLGPSAAIATVRDAICRAAATPFAVLIEGESGTGKELVARAIHRLSARRERRFTAVNSAALADELTDTELFGHTRGAFTGAVAPRQGLFEEAHGGSLFFDEVAELSLRVQAKLLRAIQEREVRRVGENTIRTVDARLLSATNRPLADLVSRGQFREDLVFRLAVIRMRLPPLRDRPEDIAPLAIRMWRDIRAIAGTKAMLGPDALARLSSHAWPGNVRQLQNVVARVSMVAPERGRVTGRHVEMVLADVDGGPKVETGSLELARASVERRTVAAALARHGGRRTAAARELGLTRQGLGKAMRRLSITERETEAGVA